MVLRFQHAAGLMFPRPSRISNKLSNVRPHSHKKSSSSNDYTLGNKQTILRRIECGKYAEGLAYVDSAPFVRLSDAINGKYNLCEAILSVFTMTMRLHSVAGYR